MSKKPRGVLRWSVATCQLLRLFKCFLSGW